MAISKEQPMRPTLIDVVDEFVNVQDNVESTNEVVEQLSQELGASIERIGVLEQDYTAIPVFEYGSSPDNEVPLNSSIGIDIEFSEAKQNMPYVLISVECDETENSSISNCYGIIISATNTGFSVRVHNLDTVNAKTVTINWLAIGV